MEKRGDRIDSRSEESIKWRKFYKTNRWTQARARFLRHNPLCVFCAAQGISKSANVVDHKRAHKGDLNLFWSEDNWQSLCFSCHNSTKQQMEKNEGKPKIGLDGWPES